MANHISTGIARFVKLRSDLDRTIQDGLEDAEKAITKIDQELVHAFDELINAKALDNSQRLERIEFIISYLEEQIETGNMNDKLISQLREDIKSINK